jgi:PIN domain nuclease of toxin-antitoxin system
MVILQKAKNHSSFISFWLEFSLKLDSHRDPFDRIIVATAQAYKLKLLTKNLRILKKFPKLAIW